MNKKVFLNVMSFVVLTFSSSAWAGLSFTNIDGNDLENIVKDFSANFAHTTVTGAKGEGAIFGFQVGIAGGITQTPEIEKLAKENGEDFAGLPHGGLIGVVSVPFGITLEAMTVPSLEATGTTFSNTGMALKWTISDSIPLPVNLALRAHYTSTSLDYNQLISGVNTDVKFTDTITGLQALLGFNLVVVKPYIGIGTISADGELSVTGSQTIFDNTFSTGQKASKSITDTQMLAGIQVNMLLLQLGLEYSQQFGGDRYTAKLALGF